MYMLSYLLNMVIVSMFSILVFLFSQTCVCKHMCIQITIIQMFSPECKNVMELMLSSRASGVWHLVPWLGIKCGSTILKQSSLLIIDKVPESQRLNSSLGSFEVITVKSEAFGGIPAEVCFTLYRHLKYA